MRKIRKSFAVALAFAVIVTSMVFVGEALAAAPDSGDAGKVVQQVIDFDSVETDSALNTITQFSTSTAGTVIAAPDVGDFGGRINGKVAHCVLNNGDSTIVNYNPYNDTAVNNTSKKAEKITLEADYYFISAPLAIQAKHGNALYANASAWEVSNGAMYNTGSANTFGKISHKQWYHLKITINRAEQKVTYTVGYYNNDNKYVENNISTLDYANAISSANIASDYFKTLMIHPGGNNSTEFYMDNFKFTEEWTHSFNVFEQGNTSVSASTGDMTRSFATLQVTNNPSHSKAFVVDFDVTTKYTENKSTIVKLCHFNNDKESNIISAGFMTMGSGKVKYVSGDSLGNADNTLFDNGTEVYCGIVNNVKFNVKIMYVGQRVYYFINNTYIGMASGWRYNTATLNSIQIGARWTDAKIENAKIYYTDYMFVNDAVINTDSGTYTFDSVDIPRTISSIDLYYSKNIALTETGTFAITNKDTEETVAVTPSYDTSANKVTLTPTAEYIPNGTYKLTASEITNATDLSAEFTVNDNSLLINTFNLRKVENSVVVDLEGTGTLSCYLIIAEYTTDSSYVDSLVQTKIIPINSVNDIIQAPVADAQITVSGASGYKYKAFLWNNFVDIEPLAASISLN